MRAIISELPFVDNTLKVYAKKTQRRLQNLETITKLFQMVHPSFKGNVPFEYG